MERPSASFPWGLLVIAVLLGWGTLTAPSGWIRYGGLVAVLVVAGALIFQVVQRERGNS